LRIVASHSGMYVNIILHFIKFKIFAPKTLQETLAIKYF